MSQNILVDTSTIPPVRHSTTLRSSIFDDVGDSGGGHRHQPTKSSPEGNDNVTGVSAVSPNSHPETDAAAQTPTPTPATRHNTASTFSQKSHKAIENASAQAEKIWLWELLACLLSIACIVAIVGVLIYEDNQPLEEWSLVIGPNAVVSFIGTLAKSSFLLAVAELTSQQKWLYFLRKPQKLNDLQLFDDAAQGPWGSFKLIVLRHRHALVASFAALVVLVALLVDPFIQLVFSFPLRPVWDPTHSPTFQTATEWNPNLVWRTVQIEAETGAAAVGDGMVFAILTGLYQQPLNMSTNCPTGNCAWRNVTTLAVCGSCSNLTSEIEVNCQGHSPSSSSLHTCNYSFASGSVLQASICPGRTNGTFYNTQWNSTAPKLPTDLVHGDVPRLVDFEAVKLPLSTQMNTLAPPTAFRCSLDLCTKEWPNFLVVNNTVEAGVVLKHPLYVSTRPHTDHGSLYADGMLYMSNRSFMDSDNGPNYAVNRTDFINLAAYLQQLFTLGWYSNGHSTRPFEGTLVVPDVGRPLALDPNLTTVVGDLGYTMTENIRGSTGSTAQIGQSIITKTYIKVRWAWLALPIVLTASTTILLLITILQTHRREAVVWKSSGLALLFCRLENASVPTAPLGTEEKLENEAKDMERRQLVLRENVHVFVAQKEK